MNERKERVAERVTVEFRPLWIPGYPPAIETNYRRAEAWPRARSKDRARRRRKSGRRAG